jgi:hypothetical protein
MHEGNYFGRCHIFIGTRLLHLCKISSVNCISGLMRDAYVLLFQFWRNCWNLCAKGKCNTADANIWCPFLTVYTSSYPDPYHDREILPWQRKGRGLYKFFGSHIGDGFVAVDNSRLDEENVLFSTQVFSMNFSQEFGYPDQCVMIESVSLKWLVGWFVMPHFCI